MPWDEDPNGWDEPRYLSRRQMFGPQVNEPGFVDEPEDEPRTCARKQPVRFVEDANGFKWEAP